MMIWWWYHRTSMANQNLAPRIVGSTGQQTGWDINIDWQPRSQWDASRKSLQIERRCTFEEQSSLMMTFSACPLDLKLLYICGKEGMQDVFRWKPSPVRRFARHVDGVRVVRVFLTNWCLTAILCFYAVSYIIIYCCPVTPGEESQWVTVVINHKP